MDEAHIGGLVLYGGTEGDMGEACRVERIEECCRKARVRYVLVAEVAPQVGLEGETAAEEGEFSPGKGVQKRGIGHGVAVDDGGDATRLDADGDLQWVAPAVMGISIVGPEKGH